MTGFLRPTSLTEALAYLDKTRATVAAGCTDLFPATERRDLAGPILDVTAIEEMRGIMKGAVGWRIGGATTWSDVLAADLPPAFDMLKQAAREVGSVQIQTAGTVAGNLCNASPAADGVPNLLALDASVRLASSRGERVMPLTAFLRGPRQTALAPDEIMVSVEVPDAAARGISRFLKLGARRYLVISIAMVSVRIEVEQGRISSAYVAVGACSAVARRVPLLEAQLTGMAMGADVPGTVQAAHLEAVLSPIDDIRADAAYRGAAAAELVRRALSDLVITESRAA